MSVETDPRERLRRLLHKADPVDEGREKSRPSSSAASSELLARIRQRLETPAPTPAALLWRAPAVVPGSSPGQAVKPSPIPFGFLVDSKGEPTKPFSYAGERGILLYGLNGAGKSTRWLIELLMTSVGRSICVLDTKGELAAQTAEERKKYSDVKIVVPFGTVGLTSDGYSPGAALNPQADDFYKRAEMYAEAIIEVDPQSKHWDESAGSLMQGGIMFEAELAARERRPFSMARVRKLFCEPEEWETVIEGGKRVRRQTKGITVNVARMIKEGSEIVAQLVGRFVREHGQNELTGIASTFDTKTKFLLDPHIASDLEKGNWSFRQLRERCTTVYIVLPPDEISRKRRYTRLLLTDALLSHFEPGKVGTLFILDEYRAAVGQMSLVNDVWSLVRGYNLILCPIFQSALQLKTMIGEEWENWAAQAGMVATIGPPNDLELTAEWMSKRSGVKTVLQSSLNFGDTVNSGNAANAGTASSQQGLSTNAGGGYNYGRNKSGGLSIQQVERRAFTPQQLMDMKAGECRAWFPGYGSKSVQIFAPNYWNRKAGWVSRVKPNPLRNG